MRRLFFFAWGWSNGTPSHRWGGVALLQHRAQAAVRNMGSPGRRPPTRNQALSASVIGQAGAPVEPHLRLRRLEDTAGKGPFASYGLSSLHPSPHWRQAFAQGVVRCSRPDVCNTKSPFRSHFAGGSSWPTVWTLVNRNASAPGLRLRHYPSLAHLLPFQRLNGVPASEHASASPFSHNMANINAHNSMLTHSAPLSWSLSWSRSTCKPEASWRSSRSAESIICRARLADPYAPSLLTHPSQ